MPADLDLSIPVACDLFGEGVGGEGGGGGEGGSFPNGTTL